MATLLIVVTFLLTACSSTSNAGPTSGPRFASEPPAAWQGPTVTVDDLPPEAQQTLLLVADGGPFPYEEDGSTFQNREGILPDEPAGYYAEYTVETPGSADRGARRLVVGDDRFVYYTGDHYDSFRFVTG